MKKLGKVILILLGLVLVVGASVLVYHRFRPSAAGLSVETSPKATVFINGTLVGKTPFEITQAAGEITLKLVPETGSGASLVFETRVTLNPKVKTVVKREFGRSEESTSGEIVSLEKTTENQASLVVVTEPEAAQITLDGLVKGFSPYKISSLTPGQHQLIVAVKGYIERRIVVNAQAGYKLTAVVKMAASEIQVTPTPAPKPIETVEILETPGGFLRVRAEPNMTSAELARVKTGDKFPLLGTSQDLNWYEIQYEASDSAKVGWVSAQYVQTTTPP